MGFFWKFFFGWLKSFMSLHKETSYSFTYIYICHHPVWSRPLDSTVIIGQSGWFHGCYFATQSKMMNDVNNATTSLDAMLQGVCFLLRIFSCVSTLSYAQGYSLLLLQERSVNLLDYSLHHTDIKTELKLQ